ncbi:hypothetical protein, partial [Desulfovibrio sp.]|uniref:hypothetical protein n=1 Tax=Desulfovibrio sp. TaxID=885 RepID=UPI00307BFAF4
TLVATVNPPALAGGVFNFEIDSSKLTFLFVRIYIFFKKKGSILRIKASSPIWPASCLLHPKGQNRQFVGEVV